MDIKPPSLTSASSNTIGGAGGSGAQPSSSSSSSTTAVQEFMVTDENKQNHENGTNEDENVLRGQVVNIEGAKNRVWLVKVPLSLAEEWHNAEPDALLGSVEIVAPQRGGSTANDTEPRIRILDQQGQDTYQCRPIAKKPSVYVISRKRKAFRMETDEDYDDDDDDDEEDSDADLDEEIPPADQVTSRQGSGYGAAIYAAVDKSLTLIPERTTERAKMLGKRLRSQKEMRILDDADLVRRARPIRRIQETEVSDRRPSPVPVAPKRAERAERMDREHLQQLLVALFNRHGRLKLREVREAINQPMEWLKENLSQVAEYNTGGEYMGTYELKAEYKVSEGTQDDRGESSQGKDAGSSGGDEWV